MDNTIVAVDLGSNSFRLQIADVVNHQVYVKESYKETVQLGAGLNDALLLDDAAQARALATLARFGDRIRGFSPSLVRVVGTNTLRVARNVGSFLHKAERALGFPIDVVSGFEEARLIFNGAAHALPSNGKSRFVVDVGGGSTEVMVGVGSDIHLAVSLQMGCVAYSRRFFPGGRISEAAFEQAELAARLELQPMAEAFLHHGWQEIIGCSGTVKVLCELSWQQADVDEPDVCVRKTLLDLRRRLIDAGTLTGMKLDNVNEDRMRVLAGGLSVLLAVFSVFGLERMRYSEGALLLGVLYDHIGRIQDEDMRDKTVSRMMQRYHVDAPQARRVEALALALHAALEEYVSDLDAESAQLLRWAALLHEVGKSISVSGYHRHSAYILHYADMPGFSRKDQLDLAMLVYAQRGKLSNVAKRDEYRDLLTRKTWALVLCLRLAILFYRARQDMATQWLLTKHKKVIQLTIPGKWLERNPLVASVLEDEAKSWADMPIVWRLIRT